LIIGDGSGSGAEDPCGWACALIDSQKGFRKLFYGAMNVGSITVAEIMPYLQSVIWYSKEHGKNRVQELKRQLHVHIVTDNKAVADVGNQRNRKMHPELFAVLNVLEQKGYIFHFHHQPRYALDLTVLMDEVCRQARASLLSAYQEALKKLKLPGELTIYDVTPG
jgi:hypothetical protein